MFARRGLERAPGAAFRLLSSMNGTRAHAILGHARAVTRRLRATRGADSSVVVQVLILVVAAGQLAGRIFIYSSAKTREKFFPNRGAMLSNFRMKSGHVVESFIVNTTPPRCSLSFG